MAEVISLSARWWTTSRGDHSPGASRASNSVSVAFVSASVTTR